MTAFERNRSFTQLIEFEIEPHQQEALVSALSAQTERLAQHHSGLRESEQSIFSITVNPIAPKLTITPKLFH